MRRRYWRRVWTGKYESVDGLYTIERIGRVWVWKDRDYREGVYQGECRTYRMAKLAVERHDYWKACWD